MALDRIPISDFNEEVTREALQDLGDNGSSPYFVIRYALTGDSVGVEVPHLLELLGKNTTIRRLHQLLVREMS